MDRLERFGGDQCILWSSSCPTPNVSKIAVEESDLQFQLNFKAGKTKNEEETRHFEILLHSIHEAQVHRLALLLINPIMIQVNYILFLFHFFFNYDPNL